MGIRDRPISPRSPWQNGYVERLIGTVRRECLDRILIFGEAHLRRVLASYAAYLRAPGDCVLQSGANALGITERCAIASSSPTIRNHYRCARSVGAASSLCADIIFGKDRRRRKHNERSRPNLGFRYTQGGSHAANGKILRVERYAQSLC